MALINHFARPLPQADVLGMGIQGFDTGQNDRRNFDARQVLAGNTGAKPPTFLERLTGMFGGQPEAAQPAVGTNLDTLMTSGLPQPQTAADRVISGDHAAVATAQDPTLTDYFASARASESGGNDAAANPNSSALGRYQFLEGTWNGLMQQHPELGLTADGRTDPAQQERAMQVFTQENAAALAAKGLAVNPGSLYAAHFLGAGGASNVLGQDPSAPVSAYVDPGVVEANPQLANMSVGDFIEWTNSKGGNSSGGYSAPMPYDQPREGTSKQFTPEEMATLLASEETRPFAMQLLQNQQQAGRYETMEMPDGSIRQIDRMTGEQSILQGAPAPAKPITPTALMQNLEAAGLRPGTPEYQEAVIKGIQNGVTVNTGDNSGAFGKKADELAATRLGDIVTSGQGAAQFMGDIQALAAIGGQIETGKGAEIMTTLGPYAEALGVDIQGLGEAQAYQSVIDRLAPQMKPVGAGATSDFDARQFLSSLPGLGKTPEGNAIIMQTLSALQEHKMAAAEIAGMAFNPSEAGGITWQEAEKRIRELPNPYEGFNEYAKTVQPNASATLPQGVTEEDIEHTMQVHGMTREQVLEAISATP